MHISEAAPVEGGTTTRRTGAGRRTARVAVVGVLAAAAVGFAASPGLAATGRVTVGGPTGPIAVLVNPPAGCHQLRGALPPGTTVRNQTDATIVVYTGGFCTGFPSIALPPGDSTVFSPGSIQVLS
ncbi:hypothetical protein [Plantactinospora endophytica]|uniref:Uncharacterized protein n=1 Tax=Plantactinospora endophytica TaxID=673535 RepID=A0ABQ4DTS3_9ACTN|nr:hypothetical protein [Plantactinospora endophytica]GIG85845.1 hypothetical protein Pen02_07810 [Plantactinospora endophytica]